MNQIEDITKRNKVPIIVGGTHYYIEALLWFEHLSEEKPHSAAQEQNILNVGLEEKDVEMSDYEKLKKVDPLRAEKLHPNDTRKIKRSLEVITCHTLQFNCGCTE